jgi:hypothetical protein
MPAVSDFTMKTDRYILCLFLQSLILLWRLTCIFFVYSCILWFYYEADTYLFIPAISDFTTRLTYLFFVYDISILCLFPQSLILLRDWHVYTLFIPTVSDFFYYEGWQVDYLFIPAISYFTLKLTCIFFCLFIQSLILLWRLTVLLFVYSCNLILLWRLTGIFFVYSFNLWFYYEGWHVYSLFIPAFSDFTMRLTRIFVYSWNLWFYYEADMYILCLFPQSLILLRGWHVYSLFIHTNTNFTMKADSYILFLFLQSDFTTSW